MRRRLPIRVESPCQESWLAMSPRGAGRHCTRCEQTVLDLTRVPRSTAERLLREHGGKVCARVVADAHGVAQFAPEPLSRSLGPVLLAGALAACSPEPDTTTAPAPLAQAPSPDDAADPDASPLVHLTSDAPGSFGGSLATGVMMPISPDAPPPPPIMPPHPTGGISPPADDEPVVPTDEQRVLTRRKHQRRVPFAYPPSHHLMGAISIAD